MSLKKVLVIDDSKDIQAVLAALLGREYTLSSAFDAVQGGIMARNGHPDLIILDINLPGGVGEVLLVVHVPVGDECVEQLGEWHRRRSLLP